MSTPASECSSPASTAGSAFGRAVERGLTSSPKFVPAAWLYDDLGSALFEAICLLPWYRVTRGERDLIEREATNLAQACSGVDFVVELGPGGGEKLVVIVRALVAQGGAPAVHLIDISAAALKQAGRTLEQADVADITGVRADYREGIDRLRETRRGEGAALVAFLGSNIGNFHWSEAVALLRRLRNALEPGDRVLLGADLVKPEADLLLAYDDPIGVTAAFNRNLLVRMNRELGATFDLETFDHRAVWNRSESRIEMHLVSRAEQLVPVPGAGCTATFGAGESIWTESSYKFEVAQLDELGAATGMTTLQRWRHQDAGFALTLFGVV